MVSSKIQFRSWKLHGSPDPTQKLSLDRPANADFFSQEKPLRKFSVNPTSSIRTRLQTPFLQMPFPRPLVCLWSLRKGVFGRRGSFQKRPSSRDSRDYLKSLEILESPRTVEKKGESDHFPEILENLEILEITEIPPVKRPL